MKKIDTEELMLNCYIDPNYFEETMRERFGENEEIKMLCYLCEEQGLAQSKILEYIYRFDIKLDELDLNTEKGEASRREFKKLKQYVYYCCEDELGLLVKYVNPIPALSDSCELKLDEFYNVIKIEGDDYIIVDETGEDWTYPSSMFEIISSNRVSNAFPQVKHKLAEQEMKNGDYQEAVSCAASVFGLIGDKDLIEEKHIDSFIKAYNLRKSEIDGRA